MQSPHKRDDVEHSDQAAREDGPCAFGQDVAADPVDADDKHQKRNNLNDPVRCDVLWKRRAVQAREFVARIWAQQGVLKH